jgi:hypothetical protein
VMLNVKIGRLIPGGRLHLLPNNVPCQADAGQSYALHLLPVSHMGSSPATHLRVSAVKPAGYTSSLNAWPATSKKSEHSRVPHPIA